MGTRQDKPLIRAEWRSHMIEATFKTTTERDELLARLDRILVPDKTRPTCLPGLTNYYPNLTGIVAMQVHSEGVLFVLDA
jgi:hypothetical protein